MNARLPCLPLASKPQARLALRLLVQTSAGKDHCANLWVSYFGKFTSGGITARAVSISDTIKREYAAATGTDLGRLLRDRAFKEHHRATLTSFFHEQVRQRPQLQEQHFLDVVTRAANVEVLFITGMRDVAPIATLSHLVPHSRLIQVQIEASDQTRWVRRGRSESDSGDRNVPQYSDGASNSPELEYSPNLTFDNETAGSGAPDDFAQHYLLPLINEDLQHLTNMVRKVAGFPRQNIDFHHVLGICQQQGGLNLCTSLLRSQFIGDWTRVDVVVSCEVGGLVFASALAATVALPLIVVRKGGKLPPPTLSVPKASSHISSLASDEINDCIEMEQHLIPQGASVVIVDDVLATGETLCAVLCLLEAGGVPREKTSVMTIAEFPIHRARKLLWERGFGRVPVQSLLVFGSA